MQYVSYFPVPTEPGAIDSAKDMFELWKLGDEDREFRVSEEMVPYGVYIIEASDSSAGATYAEWFEMHLESMGRLR